MDILKEWLKLKKLTIDWDIILNYLNNSENRTNENSSIAYHFIISLDQESQLKNYFEIEEQKGLDLLSEALFTYLELDKNKI